MALNTSGGGRGRFLVVLSTVMVVWNIYCNHCMCCSIDLLLCMSGGGVRGVRGGG